MARSSGRLERLRAGAPKKGAPKARELDTALLTSAIEAMTQGIAVFGPDRRLLFHNRRYADLMRFPEGFLRPGMDYVEIAEYNEERGVFNLAGPTVPARERVLAITGADRQYRSELKMPWGTVLALRHVPLGGGGFVNTYTSISARKRAETAAQRTQELLQATLDNMADGIRVFDADLKLIAFNKRAFEFFDYPEEMQRLGVSYEEIAAFVHERGDYAQDDSSMEARVERARRGIGRATLQPLPNGRIVQKRRNPMPGGGFVSTYSDVTELQNAKAALAEKAKALETALEELKCAQAMLVTEKERAVLANRSKSEFLANMSHELRTPLNAIIGFSELICEELKGPVGVPCYKDYAADIRESGVHLLNIINDLLDISKIEAGKAELRDETVDIARAFESCITLVMERAKAGKVSLAARPIDHIPRIRADARMIKQILLNLTSNAVKFTAAGGKVTLDAWIEKDGRLAISVADTGIGIAPEDIPRALTPFTQIDNTLDRRFEGTGLGLPLTKSLAELHGGDLSLESVPGKGTTAIVRLPAGRVLEAAA